MSRRVALLLACPGTFALAFALGSDRVVLAQSPVRIGSEFQINTYTPSSQLTTRSSIGIGDNRDFVVVWMSLLQEGSSYGVFGQRFSSSGVATGSEFQVNTRTLGIQRDPAVATDADGDFVVAWSSTLVDGAGAAIVVKRFDASGRAIGTDFRVNVYTVGNQSYPAVARAANGDFVVTWRSDHDGAYTGVFGRRFDAAGDAQGVEFQVNTFTAGTQQAPAVDALGGGDFIVVWESSGDQDGEGFGVFGQRFDSAANKQGVEFRVNAYTPLDQDLPVVGLDVDGAFAVAWRSAGQDGDSSGIFARVFDSVGAPLGGDVPVNTHFTDQQSRPSIAVDASGDFVVAWDSRYQDGSSSGVFARFFRAGAVAIGGEIPVNSTVASSQRVAAVGSTADGDFVVAWSSYDQDAAGSAAVIGQRFDVPAILDIDGNGQLTALTDGILVLRFLFGFTGTPLTAGAIGADCTRCDSSSLLSYLQSLT